MKAIPAAKCPSHRRRFSVLEGMAIGLLMALFIGGCGSMAEQPYYRPESTPYLNLPADSVPVQGQEMPLPTAVFFPAPTEIVGLKNPIQPTDRVLQQGRELFLINCGPCHGRDAKGDGLVGERFLPRPSDLTSEAVQSLADGELFWVETYGFSTMPPTNGRLTETERWIVVNYVRSLGKK